MWLCAIAGDIAGGLVFHWGNTIKLPWVRTVTNQYPSWYDLTFCQDVKQQQTNKLPALSILWCPLHISSIAHLVFFPLSEWPTRWFWPDLMNRKYDHPTTVCTSFRLSGDLYMVQLPAGSSYEFPHMVPSTLFEMHSIVACVMKMGNTVSIAELEPTFLSVQASVLAICHISSLMSPLFPCLPVYTIPCLKGQCRLLYSSPWNY